MFKLILLAILLSSCKTKSSSVPVAAVAATPAFQTEDVAATPITTDESESTPSAVASSVEDIKKEASTYLAATKDEPATTQDEQDFRSALAQIQKADPKAVQEFIEQQGFSKTDTKADKLQAAIASQGVDSASTSDLLKGTLITAVIISAISTIGGAAILTKNFSSLNVTDTHLSVRRFGGVAAGLSLNVLTLTVAAILLSEGDQAGSDTKPLIALAVLLGIKATTLATSAFGNIGSPDEVKIEAMKAQMRKNGAGIVEADKIIAQATLSQPSAEELEQIGIKMKAKQNVTLLEMAQFELHDPKFDAKFTKINAGANAAMLGVAAGVATLAVLTTKGLNLSASAETPKARIIRKLQEFWMRMKSLEAHKQA